MNSTVLISGASIAGPALAYWLVRRGFSPVVVERAPALRRGGYPIDVRGAAVDVVERMGLAERVRELRTGMRGLSYVDASGAVRAELRMDHVGSERDVELMRGDLSEVLYEATRDDVEYVFGDWVTGLVQDGPGVQVAFERGGTRSFDLVVGADGLHSGVRALAFGPDPGVLRHLGYTIAIFTMENVLGLDHWSVIHNVPGRLAGLYSARDDTEAKAIFGFASAPFLVDPRDEEGQKRILERAFAGLGSEVPRVLAAMWEAPDFYFESVSQVHMPSWSRGRVALAGDAAHCPSPLSGQGSTLALVGAYVLAGELAAARGDHGAAFARYEALMRPYVLVNQGLATRGARAPMPRRRGELWLRNLLLRALPHLPGRRRLAGGVSGAASKIALPGYGD